MVAFAAFIYFSNIGYQFYISSSQDLPMSFDLPKDYKELFSEDKRSQINSVYTYNSKVRTPISTFKFNNDYSLAIFKLPLQNDVSFLKGIKMSQENAYFTKGIVYSDISQNGIDLRCRSVVQAKLSNLYLKLNGDALKIIVRNDSILSCALNFRNFSLSYGLDDDVEVFAGSESGVFSFGKTKSVNLLFKKRNGFIYFIMLSGNDKKKGIEEDTLNNLIN